MFKKVNQKQSFPELEKNILKFWKEKNIFKKSVETKPADKTFSFYDGPPYATGLPHYGHLLAGTMKDVIPRFKTMQGYRVERVWGWDTHGLPIENIVEQELDFKSKLQIKEYGIDKFNEKCREKVLTYTEAWKEIVEKTGRWVDIDNAYITMDLKYMESVWWVFKEIWDKDLVYMGHKVMPYCPRCATGLSSFEVGLGGYQNKTDKAITVKFELIDQEAENSLSTSFGVNKQPTYLLAWTTTPWTLPGNLALAVNPKIIYVKIKTEEGLFILAKERLEAYGEDLSEDIVEEVIGKDLIGKKYKPLFDFYEKSLDSRLRSSSLSDLGVDDGNDKVGGKAFEVIAGDFITTEDGTGIVHIAPAFGEDDFRVAKENGIDFYMPVNDLGEFDVDVPEYAGNSVVKSETNQKIIDDLGDKVLKVENYKHSYPFCWRCDTPLIYKAIDSWFVAVEKLREQMLKNNSKVKWTPEFVGKGRMAKLIEAAPDWNISRNRFWGVPIPVWRCGDCNENQVFGSVKELEEAVGTEINDIHLHKIQDLEVRCNCGGAAKITGEVLDVWFDSGSMPYGSIHYPFENEGKFEKEFPADFIAEGIDQTRGWFNSLLILGTALFDKAPYKNVIVNGTVLAENGQKMSKRLKNYPDPLEVIHKFGADAMRFYLMDSPAVRAEDLKFAEKGVDEVVKKIALTLWNTYSFFVTYASIDGFEPATNSIKEGERGLDSPPERASARAGRFHGNDEGERNKLDQWILSELNSTIKKVTGDLENYELSGATKEMANFLDNLSNWYVRRSRRRFWKSENDADKNKAYQTLYDCLVTYLKLLAPYMPFVTEEIYKNLTGEESVHLSDWPKSNEKMIDEGINAKMAKTRKIVNFGLSARGKKNIKVRQPLSKIIVFSNDGIELDEDLVSAVKDELNVKNIEFKKDDPNIVEKIIKLDFTKAGPKFGTKVKEINRKILNNEFEFKGKDIKVGDDILTADEILVNYNSKSEEFVVEGKGETLVALDVNITNELKKEGLARDIVRIIQDLRKNAGFDVADRIITEYQTDSSDLLDVLKEFEDYVKKETLSIKLVSKITGKNVEIVKIEGDELSICLEKAVS